MPNERNPSSSWFDNIPLPDDLLPESRTPAISSALTRDALLRLKRAFEQMTNDDILAMVSTVLEENSTSESNIPSEFSASEQENPAIQQAEEENGTEDIFPFANIEEAIQSCKECLNYYKNQEGKETTKILEILSEIKTGFENLWEKNVFEKSEAIKVLQSNLEETKKSVPAEEEALHEGLLKGIDLLKRLLSDANHAVSEYVVTINEPLLALRGKMQDIVAALKDVQEYLKASKNKYGNDHCKIDYEQWKEKILKGIPVDTRNGIESLLEMIDSPEMYVQEKESYVPFLNLVDYRIGSKLNELNNLTSQQKADKYKREEEEKMNSQQITEAKPGKQKIFKDQNNENEDIRQQLLNRIQQLLSNMDNANSNPGNTIMSHFGGNDRRDNREANPGNALINEAPR